MPCTKICQISDELFGGFQIVIDLDFYYNTQEIADYVKEKLIASFKKLHLGQLVVSVNDKKFHIHDKDIYDLRKGKIDEIIWVCAHC